MVLRARFFAVFVLLVPYVAACAQGFGDLIKSSPVAETMNAKSIPPDFHAVNIKTNASDANSSFQAMIWLPMLYGTDGSGRGADLEAYDASQASWTNGQLIKTETGDFLVTYKLVMDPAVIQHKPHPTGLMRLALVRKDSIVEISPRSDITREKMAAMFSIETMVQVSNTESEANALSNIKQLTLGMIMYQTDCDDITPYAQDTKSAFAVTLPYLKNSTLFKSLNPNGGRILLNMAIAGINANSAPSPAETIMYFDEAPWPGNRHLVSFMDGHAKMLSSEEWFKCEKSLHLKLKRAAKPLPPNYWKKIAATTDLGG